MGPLIFSLLYPPSFLPSFLYLTAAVSDRPTDISRWHRRRRRRCLVKLNSRPWHSASRRNSACRATKRWIDSPLQCMSSITRHENPRIKFHFSGDWFMRWIRLKNYEMSVPFGSHFSMIPPGVPSHAQLCTVSFLTPMSFEHIRGFVIMSALSFCSYYWYFMPGKGAIFKLVWPIIGQPARKS